MSNAIIYNSPVTLKILAARLKMSVSTVSKALNDYPTINEYTRVRVKQMAEELNFTPNKSALDLKGRKSHRIGVILPDLSDQYFLRSVMEMENLALLQGYNLIIGQSNDHLSKEIEQTNMFLKSRVDGLIVAVSKETKDLNHFTPFEKLGIPVVFYGRNPSLDSSCHKVLGNTFKGSYDATEFLIHKGHREIAYIGGPRDVNFTHDRFRGYINALRDYEIPFHAERVIYTDFSRGETSKAIRSFSETASTALVAFKEPIVFEAIKHCRSIIGGHAVDFIGFGNAKFIDYLDNPPIASIEEYPELIGENAFNLLFKLINKEIADKAYQKVTVECKLVVHHQK